MKPKSLLIAASLTIVTFSSAVSWIKTRLAHEAESSLETFAQRRARSAKEIQTLEERLASIEKDRVNLQADLDESKKAKAPTATVLTPKNASPDARQVNPMEALLKDPKLQNYFFASQRASLAKNYGPFFQRLGLTPAQITKFEDILMEREEQKMDLQAVAESQGLRADSATLTTLRKQSEEKILTEQAALLGPAGVNQWQQYERTVEVRALVGKFAGAAAS